MQQTSDGLYNDMVEGALLQSIFGKIKVGDAHLEAPHFCRTPISQNLCNSVLKTSK